MRFRLVCAIATTLPMASDKTAKAISMPCQSDCNAPIASTSRRMTMAKAAIFDALPR